MNSCYKSINYCTFLGPVYVISNGSDKKVYYYFTKQFDTIHLVDTLTYYRFRGYHIDKRLISVECLECNDFQKNIAILNGGYCNSN